MQVSWLLGLLIGQTCLTPSCLPKRYQWGPRSQEVRERGRTVPGVTLSPSERFCIKKGSDSSRFSISLTAEGQSQKTVSTNHIFLRERRPEAESTRDPPA